MDLIHDVVPDGVECNDRNFQVFPQTKENLDDPEDEPFVVVVLEDAIEQKEEEGVVVSLELQVLEEEDLFLAVDVHMKQSSVAAASHQKKDFDTRLDLQEEEVVDDQPTMEGEEERLVSDDVRLKKEEELLEDDVVPAMNPSKNEPEDETKDVLEEEADVGLDEKTECTVQDEEHVVRMPDHYYKELEDEAFVVQEQDVLHPELIE